MPDIGIIASSREAAAARERRQINAISNKMQAALYAIERVVKELPPRERLFVLNHALATELGPNGVRALEP